MFIEFKIFDLIASHPLKALPEGNTGFPPGPIAHGTRVTAAPG
jgi:hypothetical protein